MQADLGDVDFIKGMETMLGIDDDQVKNLIDQLDADAMSALTDAVANQDKTAAEQIVASVTNDNVNPLFRGDNIDDAKVRKKKHRRKVDRNYTFKYGDDVDVKFTDLKTGKSHYVDGSVNIPDGPDNTVGVKIQGKTKMVDRTRVLSKVEEGVLGMVDVPNIERMQQLAGIQPAAPASLPEIVVPEATETAEVADPATAVQQTMAALDRVAALLPNVRLADLRIIRQRIAMLQTSMNENAMPRKVLPHRGMA